MQVQAVVTVVPQYDQQPTGYQVLLTSANASWAVTKFFADFEALLTELYYRYGQNVPLLGPKERGGTKEQQTSLNRDNIERTVNGVLQRPDLCADASVIAFFELSRISGANYAPQSSYAYPANDAQYGAVNSAEPNSFDAYSGYNAGGYSQQYYQHDSYNPSSYSYGNTQSYQPEQAAPNVYSGQFITPVDSSMGALSLGGESAGYSQAGYNQPSQYDGQSYGSYHQQYGATPSYDNSAPGSYSQAAPPPIQTLYGAGSTSAPVTPLSDLTPNSTNNENANHNNYSYSANSRLPTTNPGRFLDGNKPEEPTLGHRSASFSFGSNSSSNSSSSSATNSTVSRPFGAPALERKMSLGGGNTCQVCQKTVYLAEGMVIKGKNYHKACFRCATCGCSLNMSNFATHRDIPYCKEHQRVKEKEDYDQLNSERSKAHVPQSATGTGKISAEAALASGGSICAGCNTVVYAAECLKAGGRDWHRGCFRCATCSTTLTVSKVGFHKSVPYCTAHHQVIIKAARWTDKIDFTSPDFMRKLGRGGDAPSPSREPSRPFGQTQQTNQFQSQQTQQAHQPQQQGNDQERLPMHGTKLLVPYDAAQDDVGVSEIDIAEPYRGRPPPGVIEGLLMMLASPSDADKAKAAAALCHICSETDSNRELVVDMGVVPSLLNMLKMNTPDKPYVQATAAACLCNLAANARNKELLAQGGAMHTLIAVLSSGDTESAAQAAGALWSLCVDNDKNKERLAQAQAIPKLVALMNSDDYFAQAQAAGALSECSIRAEQNKKRIAENGGVPRLARLLESADLSVQRLAACALCNICANHEENKKLAREAGTLPILVKLLTSSTAAEVQSPAAGAVCNLAMNCSENRNQLIQSGAIQALENLQRSSVKGVRENAKAALDQLQ